MRFELSYTQITVYALILTIFFDMFVTKNSLLSTIRFWLSYAIHLWLRHDPCGHEHVGNALKENP